MRQLLRTGWMSNRGRQIVASYLKQRETYDPESIFIERWMQ